MKNGIILLLFLLLIIVSCDNADGNSVLKVSSDFGLDVPEPSGLSLSYDKETLWTVSDEDNCVYNITKSGRVLKCIPVNGNDLEGVVANTDSTLLIVLESTQEILEITTSGKELRRIRIPIESKFNKGLEGITYSKKREAVFVVNEKEPKLLAELDNQFNLLHQIEMEDYGDFSGICSDDESNMLWIVSDENKMIYRYTFDGEIIDSFAVDLMQIEGVTYDNVEKKLFVISDPVERLYIYQF